MLIRRLSYWIENASRSEALHEEMELHLAEKAAELEADGMTAEGARAEARRRFGNVGLKHEESREIWMTRFLSELGQDIRYGCRTMTANKAFSALAVLSLALGIGANTTIYSFMESILLRSLPVADPESLVVLNWHSRPPRDGGKESVHVMHGLQGMAWPGDKGSMVLGIFPYAAFETLREENSVFSTLFGYFNGHNHNLAIRGQATSASTEYVTGEYFRGLAVSPAAGRLIDSEDDRPGAAPVAVISFATSQQRFGGPSSAIGQPVVVDSVPFTVVGVAPPEFFGVDPAAAPDLYLPLHTNLLVDGVRAARMYPDGNYYWIEMMGRLRPGVSMAQAQAALAPRFHQWVAATATTDGERAKLPALLLNPGAAGLGSLRRQYSKPLYVLLAMVALILAIACANIANLLLARAAARRREIAVRLSIGAGRFRVIRQLLTESALLASIGGGVGVAFAIWAIRFLTFLLANGREDFTLRPDLNWHVLGAAVALSLLTGLLFGLAPALQSTRVDVIPALKEARAGQPGSQRSFRRASFGQALVVTQIGMSLLMLVAAGLFVRTLSNLQSIQLGFNRENVLLFRMNARQAGHRDPEIIAFYRDLQKQFSAIPGVHGASASHSPLLGEGTWSSRVAPVGQQPKASTHILMTTPDFFKTMQIPVVLGRAFDDRDQPGSSPVAVVSEAYVRDYFPDRNPLGQHVVIRPGRSESRDVEIVGVAKNVRYGALKGEFRDIAYLPFNQGSYFPVEEMTFALRTSGDPLRYVNTVRAIVSQADARVPVTDVKTQAAQIDQIMNQEIIFARLCTAFAILALLIACIGLYGTMSYTVARRTGEIGIRMALGAQRSAVVWMVLREVLVLAAVG